MHHFFVDKNQIIGESITIQGADVNHIKNVLRMKNGQEVLVSDGEGNEYLCIIESLLQESVFAKILEERMNTNELPSKIYLFQGLPKSDKMELIIQKAVELGAFEIIPVATKRAIVKLDSKKEESKRKRWQGICESAAKQSMRGLVPTVTKVMTFKEAVLYGKDFELKLIPYELEIGMDKTKSAIGNVKPGTSIGIFIGPEGGFEESEIEFAKENGIIPISLGKRILRTETAGLTTLSILMYLLELEK